MSGSETTSQGSDPAGARIACVILVRSPDASVVRLSEQLDERGISARLANSAPEALAEVLAVLQSGAQGAMLVIAESSLDDEALDLVAAVRRAAPGVVVRTVGPAGLRPLDGHPEPTPGRDHPERHEPAPPGAELDDAEAALIRALLEEDGEDPVGCRNGTMGVHP